MRTKLDKNQVLDFSHWFETIYTDSCIQTGWPNEVQNRFIGAIEGGVCPLMSIILCKSDLSIGVRDCTKIGLYSDFKLTVNPDTVTVIYKKDGIPPKDDTIAFKKDVVEIVKQKLGISVPIDQIHKYINTFLLHHIYPPVGQDATFTNN